VGKTGKGFPYSLPSMGPGAVPGVPAVSPQVNISHSPGGRRSYLKSGPAQLNPAQCATNPGWPGRGPADRDMALWEKFTQLGGELLPERPEILPLPNMWPGPACT